MGTTVHQSADGRNSFAFLQDSKQQGIWWGEVKADEIDKDKVYDVDYLCEIGGLDFEIKQSPLTFTPEGGKPTIYENRMVNYAADTGEALGIVSQNKYHIVQPRRIVEALSQAFKQNGLTPSTLGVLCGRTVYWMLASLGKDFDFILPGGDKVRSYLRAQSSCDGTSATSYTPTSTRQCCENTERYITAKGWNQMLRVPHSVEFSDQLVQSMNRAIGLMGEAHKETAEVWNALCAFQVDTEQAQNYFCDVYGVDLEALKTNAVIAGSKSDKNPEGKLVVSTKQRNQLTAVGQAFATGPGSNLESANGTAYGLLQSVTYITDHKAATRTRKGEVSEQSRMSSAWFGNGAALKIRAREIACELAGVKIAA